MATQTGKLNEISQAIGALQSGQENAERARVDHASRTERQFNAVDGRLASVDEKLSELSANLSQLTNNIDSKIEKSVTKYLYGGVGGIFAVALQWIGSHFWFKLP